MEAELLDLIVRSRPTILNILENRGYTVDAYRNINPMELIGYATTDPKLLRINAPKTPDSAAPLERAVVIYWIDGYYRLRNETEIDHLFMAGAGRDMLDPTRDDVIIVLAEQFHDVFHAQAIKQWNERGARISYFNIKNLISNPADHVMVPPHRKLSSAEIATVMKGLNLRRKAELPHIKFHIDMQARVLGLVPGDIVEIKRPSETAGESITYRVCSA